ncbi:MAG: tRNA (adenosine(37)-N6)-threonylcarbamoyltransferase complex ATPase subunit type 1 TsaE [Proteobacteria bacterium]|nr:tRNA (adenosine(37)-N6)-threonylcarbamoyltransferase complex ATPase subunit type 1 TsaE [Pseudomonadota bacterium]
MQEIKLKNVGETRAWAAEFAKTLCAPCVVALHGDLGMGKSEIARSIIQTLCGADTVVPSPTFTLVQSYECSVACPPSWGGLSRRSDSEGRLGGATSEKNSNKKSLNEEVPPRRPLGDTPPHRGPRATERISHFDLYRITDASELEEIGLGHACANDITLIEWPEIAAGFLPANTIHIYLEEYEGGRKLEMTE